MGMKEVKTTKKIAICERCGYEWEPRIALPKACIRCKRADWNEKR